jgi:hypothetical protein
MTGQPLTLDWDAIYQDRVLPTFGVRLGAVEHPRWTFVCGQPGSGKSTHVARLVAQLGADQTQVIIGDQLAALVPEIFRDPYDPLVQPALKSYEKTGQPAHIDVLIDRAVRLRAHVVWELHGIANWPAVARAARGWGYRVDCAVLAAPLQESWLAALNRDTAPGAGELGLVKTVNWDQHLASYHRWPAFIARAEGEVAFDTLRIHDRDGQVLFENTANTVTTQKGTKRVRSRRWSGPMFGFESLLVERLQPRSPEHRQALLTAWEALRAHPYLAFRNQPAWLHASFAALGESLQAMCADPAFGFDLNHPPDPPDPKAAAGWTVRLQSDIAATLASKDAKRQPDLPARADRLLALVGQIMAQQGG